MSEDEEEELEAELEDEDEIEELGDVNFRGMKSHEILTVKDKGKVVQMSVQDAKALLKRRKKGEAVPRKREKPRAVVAALIAEENPPHDMALVAEDVPKRYEIVDGDDDLDVPEEQREKKKRKEKKMAVGAVPRTPNNFVIDPNADFIQRDDGGVTRINVAKRMFNQLTEADLLLPSYKNRKDSQQRPLSTDHWVCLIASSDPQHQKLHFIAKNFGNLGKHAKRAHQPQYDALVRIVAETPGNETLAACQEYVETVSQNVSDGKMDSFFNRLSGARISSEIAALVWFLDACIPFAQFDSPLFKEFLRTLTGNIKDLSSSTTIMDSLLPLLYHYVTKKMCEKIGNWAAFWNTFDGWSKFRVSFVSQHYHGINPHSFTFEIFLLDLVYFPVQKFEESVASVLSHRVDLWTENMTNAPLQAGGLADQAANVQAAGRAIFGDDDMQKCQSHVIGTVYTDVEGAHDLKFNHDTGAVRTLCVFVMQNANVLKSLKRYQRTNELSEMSILLECETRKWSGLIQGLNRFLALASSVHVLAGVGELMSKAEIRRVDDFLQPSFFERLRAYVPYLSIVDEAITFYQTRKFPVGCFVPLVAGTLLQKFGASDMDAPYLAAWKAQMLQSITKRMSYILESPNNFLMSSLLHPGVACALVKLNFVRSYVIDEAFAGIVKQAILLDLDSEDGSDEEEDSRSSITTSLSRYRRFLSSLKRGEVPRIEIAQLKIDGTFWGENHMRFWQGIATKELEHGERYAPLLKVASMLLALPASEAVDESAFSGTGMTLSFHRASMGPTRLEQVTVIRSYIRQCGFEPLDIQRFIGIARREEATRLQIAEDEEHERARQARKSERGLQFGNDEIVCGSGDSDDAALHLLF